MLALRQPDAGVGRDRPLPVIAEAPPEVVVQVDPTFTCVTDLVLTSGS